MKLVVHDYRHRKYLRKILPKLVELLLNAGLEPVPVDGTRIVLASNTLEAKVEVKLDAVEYYSITVEITPITRDNNAEAIKLAEKVEEIVYEE